MGYSPWGHRRVGHNLATKQQVMLVRVFMCRFLSGHLVEFGFPGGLDGKESACSAEDPGSIPGLGRSPGEGDGNPLRYSYLESPMDRGARREQSTGSQGRTCLSD